MTSRARSIRRLRSCRARLTSTSVGGAGTATRSAPRCRDRRDGSVPGVETATLVVPDKKEKTMAKYLLLKHYRGAPTPPNDVPMDRWRPEEVDAHMQYMDDFAERLVGTGEFVDGQALAPE